MAKVVRRRKEEAASKNINWLLIGGVAVAGLVALFALLYLSFQEPQTVELSEWCRDNPENCIAMGPANAEVTVVEVYDYACPACGNFALTAGQEVADNYFNSENVNWVYFPYSLPQFQDRSPASSAAALCMAEQGDELFHEFHVGLFEIQSTEIAHTRAGFDQLAEQIGADEEAFAACLEDGRYRGAVAENLDAASLASVDSTPSFYVNDRRYTQIGSFAQLAQIIEPLLSE